MSCVYDTAEMDSVYATGCLTAIIKYVDVSCLLAYMIYVIIYIKDRLYTNFFRL